MSGRKAAYALVVVLLGGCVAGPTATPEDAQPEPIPTPTGAAGPTPTPTSAPPSPTAQGVVIKTADSQFGEMLFDGRGQAIYLFDIEATSKPECYGECAEAWPPVLTDGAPVAQGAVRADALGTRRRSEGTTQVTYAGHPLYYYAHESKNQVLCHNVREFGGLWLVITPDGEAAPH